MDADEIKYTPETVGTKKEWLGTEIRPINKSDVELVTATQYNEVLEFNEDDYRTLRGVDDLLAKNSTDYGKLPGVSDQTALEIFKNLPKGSTWLDLGCGSGIFITEVLKRINKRILPVGFDARTWEGQVAVPELVLGNINELKAEMFKNNPDGFDLITSASVFYHLHDYLSVFKKATNLLKPNGKLLVSTINQPTYQYESILDDGGNFKVSPMTYSVTYFRNRNIFSVDGSLMSIGELIGIVNRESENITLEYTSCRAGQRVSLGESCFGGGISAKVGSGKPLLNLSKVFYCFYPESSEIKRNRNDLSYIVAKTDSEAKALKNQGFVSLE